MALPIVGAAASTVATEATGGGSGEGMTGEIVNLVGGAVTGLFDFIATAIPTKLDKMRKARIKELQAQFEAGTLGLTPSQLQEIETLGAGGIQATQKEFFQRQADIMRGTSGGVAQLALASQAQAEGLRRQESELQKQLFAAERQAEQAQLGELSGLKEEQRQRNKEIRDSAIKFLTLGLASGAKGVDIAEQRRQTFGTSVQPMAGVEIKQPLSEAEITALGLTPEQIEYLKNKGLM